MLRTILVKAQSPVPNPQSNGWGFYFDRGLSDWGLSLRRQTDLGSKVPGIAGQLHQGLRSRADAVSRIDEGTAQVTPVDGMMEKDADIEFAEALGGLCRRPRRSAGGGPSRGGTCFFRLTKGLYTDPGTDGRSSGGKSAADALAVTRQRCCRYDWVLEFDIKGLFDNIHHELLMKAVRKHTSNPWIILYIQRWLKAPFQLPDGTLKERSKGTPHGGVISPLLANLFLHYAFDVWMKRNHPDKPFARYADDAVAHCHSKEEAEKLHEDLKKRFAECELELHPDKTRIIYCKDDDRPGDYPETEFDFLGYTFRPRRSKNKYGKYFINFTPAVSNMAKKAMRQTIRGWRMHLKPDKTLEDFSRMYNPVIRGWVNYYGRFYKSELHSVLRHMDQALVRWARRKYKKLARHRKRAEHWLGKIARREQRLFVHWQMGIYPAAG